jgi:PKD repeat protein
MRMSHARPLLTACLLTFGAAVSPWGVGAALAAPTANFDWAPKPVIAGTSVTFASTSQNSEITEFDWNLRGGNTCAEPVLISATCTAIAPEPGNWRVTLTVKDTNGDSDSITKRVPVQAPVPPNQPPTAAFAAVPSSPLVGEEVTFVSFSEDRDGAISAQAWDMDGDGRFDDGAGAVATHRFGSPGEKTITLLVTDDRGATSTVFRTVLVRAQAAGNVSAPAAAGNPSTPAPPSSPRPPPSSLWPPPSSPRLRLLSPFPIVRLVGNVRRLGTRIQLLSVRAPRGARALVRCRGRGCPIKRAEKILRRAPTRLKAAERFMPTGVVLEVLVHRGERIGKITRFRFRRNRRPRRIDGCVLPGTTRMARCPRA